MSHPRISGVSALYDECNLTQKGAWPQRILDQSSFENTMSVGAVAERQLFLTALQYSNDRSSLFPPQSPKGMIPVGNDVSGPKTHQYFQGSVDPLGQSLSLTSSSSSGVGVLSGLEAIPIGQGFTRVSDSGRALSLQSNMQLSSSTPASVAVSMDMTTNPSMMSNQNLYSNHIPLAQPLGQGGQQQQQHHVVEAAAHPPLNTATTHNIPAVTTISSVVVADRDSHDNNDVDDGNDHDEASGGGGGSNSNRISRSSSSSSSRRRRGNSSWEVMDELQSIVQMRFPAPLS